MTETWANVDGTNRKMSKLFAAQGGVNRKLKSLWAGDAGGVARKIFSGAVTWTWAITKEYDWADVWVDSYSSNVGLSNISHTASGGSVEYTFSSPILVRAGQKIAASVIVGGNENSTNKQAYVSINGTDALSMSDMDMPGGECTKAYTLSEDTAVNTIKITMRFQTTHYNESAGMAVRVSMDSAGYGQFVLDSSGTSENQ